MATLATSKRSTRPPTFTPNTVGQSQPSIIGDPTGLSRANMMMSVPGGLSQQVPRLTPPGIPQRYALGAASQAMMPQLDPAAIRESRGGYGTILPQSGPLQGPEFAGLESRIAARGDESLPTPGTLNVGVPAGMAQSTAAQVAAREAQEAANAGLTSRMRGLGEDEINQSFQGSIGDYAAAMRGWQAGELPHPGTYGMVSSPSAEGEPAGTVSEMRRFAEQNRQNAVNTRLGTTPQERMAAAAANRAEDEAMRQMLVQNRAAQRGAARGQRLGIPRMAPPTMTPEVAQAMLAEEGGGLSDAQRRLVDTYRYGGAEAGRMADQRLQMDIAQINAGGQQSQLNREEATALRAAIDQAELDLTANPTVEQRMALEDRLARDRARLSQLENTAQQDLPTPGQLTTRGLVTQLNRYPWLSEEQRTEIINMHAVNPDAARERIRELEEERRVQNEPGPLTLFNPAEMYRTGRTLSAASARSPRARQPRPFIGPYGPNPDLR